MDEKKYSIPEIQRLTNLSPTTLRDMLQRNGRFLAMEVRRNEEGQEEVFLDQASFERIVFLKQLELREKLSPEEYSHLVACPRGEDRSRVPAPLAKALANLGVLTTLVQTLQGCMDLMLTRYNQVLHDLQQAASDNIQMKMELEALREKQVLLVRQVQQMHEKKEDPAPTQDQIN